MSVKSMKSMKRYYGNGCKWATIRLAPLGSVMTVFGLLAAFFILDAQASMAAAKTPFDKLRGGWKCVRGGCWLKPVEGKRERVNCRVRYNVSNGGMNMAQSINCRGSFRMTASSKVSLSRSGRLTGSWTSFNNHTGRISGGASGRARGDKIFVGISGTGGYRGAMRAVIGGSGHRVTLFQVHNGRRYVVGRLSLRR
jgi:hypothetical protein